MKHRVIDRQHRQKKAEEQLKEYMSLLEKAQKSKSKLVFDKKKV